MAADGLRDWQAIWCELTGTWHGGVHGLDRFFLPGGEGSALFLPPSGSHLLVLPGKTLEMVFFH